MNEVKSTRKPFTYSDRLAIETMLTEGKSIKEIEKDIRRPSSGIIKEISKHAMPKFPTTFNKNHPCLKHETCTAKSFECYRYCKCIEYKVCPKLERSPHVCNGCNSKTFCRYIKKYYNAREAHDEYKKMLSSSRIGLHYDSKETTILIDILCPLIIQTKSVYHAVLAVNETYNTNYNKGTIYKQIERQQLQIKPIDLPRSRRRQRGKNNDKDVSYKRNIEGHTYEDCDKYKEEHKSANEMQMDTVEGIKETNAPVLLTLEIVKINFLFIFKIDGQYNDYVVEKLYYFKDIIGEEAFNILMEILLTDNGKEFINVEKILAISPNIHLFYCHPYSSYEKGSVENNHELIRRVIPKGVSLKPYSQNDLNLLCSHINSLYRESLNGKCPFDLIENYISADSISKLGLSKINPLKVNLIPELLGQKNINNIRKYLDDDDIKKANINFLNNDK